MKTKSKSPMLDKAMASMKRDKIIRDTSAFGYCKTPARVSRRELVNALHECLMQLEAARKGLENADHFPAIRNASRLLEQAGHPGFTL